MGAKFIEYARLFLEVWRGDLLVSIDKRWGGVLKTKGGQNRVFTSRRFFRALDCTWHYLYIICCFSFFHS